MIADDSVTGFFAVEESSASNVDVAGGVVGTVWGCVDENVICNMYDCVVGYFGFCQECVVVVLRMQDFYVCFEYTGLLINNECVVLCFR